MKEIQRKEEQRKEEQRKEEQGKETQRIQGKEIQEKEAQGKKTGGQAVKISKEPGKTAAVMARLCLTAIAAVIVMGLTACGNISGSLNSTPGEYPQGEEETEKASPFHSVPYFQDDTGQDARIADGYLYGYWCGRLCRYDLETKKETVLFEAPCNQEGSFCIREDVIYFLVNSYVTSLTDADTCLYRVNADGSNLTLLDGELPNGVSYELDFYENILYLMCRENADSRKNLYYRLDDDGSVAAVSEEQTLYRMLPEGYQEVNFGQLPSLPYQMRNYGYFILYKMEEKDDIGELYAYDPKSEVLEQIGVELDTVDLGSLFLTNDALCYCEDDDNSYGVTWYRLSLDDLQDPKEWMLFKRSGMRQRIFYNEKGAYFVEYANNSWNLYRVGWEEDTPKRIYWRKTFEYDGGNSVFRYQTDLLYWDGESMYYNADETFYLQEDESGRDCIVKENLAEDEREIFCYYGRRESGERLEDICIREKEIFQCYPYLSGTAERQGGLEITLSRVFFTEETEGAEKINAYLEDQYGRYRQELTDYREAWNEEGCMTGVGSYLDVTAYVDYLDSNYVVLCICSDSYWSGAAHPNGTYDYYVFDRITGERLALTDLVEESPEEICDIIAPYIEKDFSFSEWTPRESILEPDRFFLTETGIGIHYDRYELASYAQGDLDFVIPYSEFTGEKFPGRETR